jgi:hypothetical protein
MEATQGVITSMANPLVVGRPIIVTTTGSAQPVLGRSGQLLGFFASATGSVLLYDAQSAAAAAAGNQILPATACAVGWNPFPVDLLNGLVSNASVALTFVVA